MSLLWRYVVASWAIVAVAMAWWYPEPVLIRGELVDWGRLYERRHTPPERMVGAMALGKALVQSFSEPLPLTEFIAKNTDGRTVAAKDAAWTDIFKNLDAAMAQGAAPVRFFRSAQPPFSELGEDFHFVELRDERGVRHMEYRFIPAREFETVDVPQDLAFPLRAYWPAMLLGSVAAVAFGLAGRRAASLVEASSAGRGVRWSAVFCVLFTGMILWPFVHGTIGSGLSFASILMGGLLMIGGLVGMWLFGRQAVMLRRMVGGEHLAHFTYSSQEWTRFAEWSHGEEAADKKTMWRLVFAITLVVGLGFMAVMRDEASVLVFGVLMALMAVLRLLAAGLPRLALRHHLQRPGEVYVGEEGLFLNGTVHSWTGLGARLDRAVFESAPLPHLRLVYSYLMMAGRSLYFFRNFVTVRVPVPAGREDEGKALMGKLNSTARGGS